MSIHDRFLRFSQYDFRWGFSSREYYLIRYTPTVYAVYGGHEMRKLIALLFIATLIFTCAGCGDNAGKAREYIESGDAYEERVSELTDELQSKSSDFRAFALERLKQGQMPNEFMGEWKPLMDDCVTLIDQIFENLQSAESEYMKIKDLEGVEEYKEYVDMMLQFIDIQTSYYELERDEVTYQYETFSDPDTSIETLDTTLAEISSLYEQSSVLYDQMKQLDREIEQYKEDVLGMPVSWEEKRSL
jgi:hypothetical protein